MSNDQFEKMIAHGELIEYAKYVNHYYGTPRKFVEDNKKRTAVLCTMTVLNRALKTAEKLKNYIIVI